MAFFGRFRLLVFISIIAVCGLVSNTAARASEPAPAGMLALTDFAALKSLQPPPDGRSGLIAATAGYQSPGDGGGSTYEWQASSTATPDGIFVVEPPGATKGRWLLRLPGGAIHPEQAGARCDGTGDDTAALTAISHAIESVRGWNAGIIALNPGKMCVIAGKGWATPVNTIVRGPVQPNNRPVIGLNFTTTGFIVAPSATLRISQGSELENVAILRENLPPPPRDFDQMARQIALWAAEDGAIEDVVPLRGRSGAGCSVGDLLYIPGLGTTEVVRVAGTADGAVTSVAVVRSGSYVRPPTAPATAVWPSGPATATCTTAPQFTFKNGTPRSVGVWMDGPFSQLRHVMVIGFNTAVFSNEGSLVIDDVSFDSINGVDLTGSRSFIFAHDLSGGQVWSAASAGSFGAWQLLKIENGGTANAVGDRLTLQGGDCTMQPQLTVDAVSGGAVTAAHVSTYGNCRIPPRNPVSFSNLHGGRSASATIYFAGYDFRPGTAYYIHDTCDGCQFNDLITHGFLTGFWADNVWEIGLSNLDIEGPCDNPACNMVPIASDGTMLPNFGLRTTNCTSINASQVRVAAAIGFGLYAAPRPYAPIPKLVGSCGSYAVHQTVIGGRVASAYSNGLYGIDLGPHTNGTIVGVELITAFQKVVNVQAHVDRWSLSDMVVDDPISPVSWISIDPSSAAVVSYNAAGSATQQIDSHLASSGAMPRLTACGRTAHLAAGSTDTKGVILLNSDVVKSCTLIFATRYETPPVPIVSISDPSENAAVSEVSTAGFTTRLSNGLSGGRIYYQVMQ